MKSFWLRFALLGCFFSSCGLLMPLVAQTKNKSSKATPKPTEEPTPKRGASKNVQVFDADDGYTAPTSLKIESNVFKINALDAILGIYSVSYERMLNAKMSAEATIGLTYPTTLLSEIFGSSGFSSTKVADAWATASNPKMSTVLGIAGRYYLGRRNRAPEGGYIMAGFQTRSYKYQTNAFIQPNNRSLDLVDAQLTYTDLLRLAIGYQIESGSSFTWDFYIGLALRNVRFTGSYHDGVNVYNGTTSLQTRPNVLLGAKWGILF